MNSGSLKDQIELMNKSVGELINQNRIFEQQIDRVMKGTQSNDDKDKIRKVQIKVKQIMSLAKEGKTNEVESLIEDLKTWSK